MDFTCSQVMCSNVEYIAVCLFEGIITVCGISGICIVCWWMRAHRFCPHCGKLMSDRHLSARHRCPYQPAEPCVFCGQVVREVLRAISCFGNVSGALACALYSAESKGQFGDNYASTSRRLTRQSITKSALTSKLNYKCCTNDDFKNHMRMALKTPHSTPCRIPRLPWSLPESKRWLPTTRNLC